ncbi:MAG: SagB/ThcOx family dehydrogenase [Aquificae bacterium]|nr:SagB/ThcOx family dehydrogenase [Aquificota bacterium]
MENFAVYYHDRTKHLPWRYAASPGYLDWETQPYPYRFWEGAPRLELPFPPDPEAPYEYLYLYPKEVKPFGVETVAKFLELALGLSAVKSAGGSTWTVRMNPSSGNLHPTEAYLVIPDLGGLSGVFHYNPYLHALEKLRDLPAPLARALKNHFGTEGFMLVLTAIPWREAWKYGERAFRYCLLDAGHAVGSVRFSANLQGWKATYLNALSDDDLETILGFDKVSFPPGEEELPELALWVYPNSVSEVPKDLPPELVEAFRNLPFYGRPNLLSPERRIWSLVYEAFKRLKKPKTPPRKFVYENKPLKFLVEPAIKRAAEVIRRRRSGHAYDPRAAVSEEAFLQILDRTLPRNFASPFDAEVSPAYANLVVFVHRVVGLPPGLYLFVRNRELLPLLRGRLRPEFLWEEVREDLFLLAEGDLTREAGYLSCMQDIAADAAFALAVLSLFGPVVERAPWEYRNLHYEAGLIGQALYLEATALGLKGTGIGCFYDDLTHQLLGLAEVEPPLGGNLLETHLSVDRTFQVLYHFAVGKAFEDPRLKTLPPYSHLRR